MKNTIIKTTGLFLFSLILATALNGQPQRRGNFAGSHGEGRNPEHLSALERLDLTEEQQEAFKELRLKQYNAMKPLRNQMSELRARERTLLSEEKVDMKTLDKVIDDQTDLMNKMKKLQVEHQVAVKGILTDEQIMNLEMWRGKRDSFRNNGNGNRGPSYRNGPYHRNMG
jgi:Spy/CpxP family protein refolding chaperone